MGVLQDVEAKTDRTEMLLRDGRKLVWCCVLCACSILSVQRASLQGSLEAHKHLTTEQKNCWKEVDSMSIICAIASHSMTRRWKRNCAIFSSPLLGIFVFCLLLLPISLSVVPN